MSSESLFDRIVAKDNLLSAWIKARHHARTEEVYYDSYAYETFEEHLQANLTALRHKLLYQTYHPMPLRYVTIPKGDQIRKIYFLQPRDSVAIQAVINVMGPSFEGQFSQYSFGYRLAFGDSESHSAYLRWQDRYEDYVTVLRGFLNKGLDAWYMITDIENYYPSINLRRLYGLIAAQVSNERTLALVQLFLELPAIGVGEQEEGVQGLPPGTIYAHFFANIYLAEFDELALQHTQGYARYVDDICLVCRDEESLRATEQLLRKYLARWQHKLKAEKTIRCSVKDWEPLIDHTRKMKYATRVDITGALDFGEDQVDVVSEAEGLLHGLYLEVEKEGDIGRLVEEAGFVISRLHNLGAANLAQVIYSLLETSSLKPSTLRVALSCLLDMELPDLSFRLHQYLVSEEDEQAYRRTNLLQVLPHFCDRAGQLRNLLISEFSRDSNYLVRANTYVALKELALCEAISLSVEELRLLTDRETSHYALQHLIDGYPYASGEAIWASLVSMMGRGPNLTGAVARAFCKLLASGRVEAGMLESIFPVFAGADSIGVEGYIHLFHLISCYGAFWMLESVLQKARTEIGEQLSNDLFSVTALEVIGTLASTTSLSRLYQFAGFIDRLGLRTEATLGIEEVIGRAKDSELRHRASAQRQTMRQVSLAAGLPSWYADDPTCNRGLYREQRGDSSYLCFEFESRIRNCTGTLELISVSRIRSGGFAGAEQWLAYLRQLHGRGVICLIDADVYEEDEAERVFCLYEKPQGFGTLREWLQHPNADGLLAMPVVLKLALSLVRLISETKHGEFHVTTVDPLNVLWNPNDEIKLLNLGASLGIPSYQCGLPQCSDPSDEHELGPTTATYYLGLLLLQLITKTCPLEAVNSTRSRAKDHPELYELFANTDIPPHLRLAVTRLLQRVPEYRYQNLDCLKEDLSYITDFVHSCSHPTVGQAGNARDWYTLQDFASFRLRISSRNPEFRLCPPIERATRMLESLSRSLGYFPASALSKWQTNIKRKPVSPSFPSGSHVRTLSPEGCRLLGIAQGWEEAVAPGEPHQYVPTPFAKLCLYRILVIEASACLVSSLMASSHVSQETLAEMKHLVLEIMAELKGTPSDAFTVHLSSLPSVAITVRLCSEDLQEMQQFITWLDRDSTSHRGKRVNSLRAAGLFLTLFGAGCDVHKNGRLIARSPQVLSMGGDDLGASDMWQLLKDCTAFDKEIEHFENLYRPGNCDSSSIDMQQSAEVWMRLPETLALIQNLNPCRRWAAELYAYDYWTGEGLVRLVFPRSGELDFARTKAFVSGNLLKQRDTKRPVRVDVHVGTARTVCSFLAPSQYFRELPLPIRRYSPSQIAGWMRSHPNLRRVALAGLGLGLISVPVELLHAIPAFSVPWYLKILSESAGAIALNLISDSIAGYLATRHPEEEAILAER